MLSLSLVSAGVILVGTAVVGVIFHELSHALALRMAGISCRMEFLPTRGDTSGFPASVRGPLARVTPTRLPDDVSPWHLRAAAIMPLCLSVPLVLVPVGAVPDPFAVGDTSLELATIAWVGCSIPSPGDFSLLWYPERAIATHCDAVSPGE